MATQVQAIEPVAGSEAERILAWRLEQLARSGFDFEPAMQIALCSEVDLHDAIDLVKRGCEPALAARILL